MRTTELENKFWDAFTLATDLNVFSKKESIGTDAPFVLDIEISNIGLTITNFAEHVTMTFCGKVKAAEIFLMRNILKDYFDDTITDVTDFLRDKLTEASLKINDDAPKCAKTIIKFVNFMQASMTIDKRTNINLVDNDYVLLSIDFNFEESMINIITKHNNFQYTVPANEADFNEIINIINRTSEDRIALNYIADGVSGLDF